MQRNWYCLLIGWKIRFFLVSSCFGLWYPGICFCLVLVWLSHNWEKRVFFFRLKSIWWPFDRALSIFRMLIFSITLEICPSLFELSLGPPLPPVSLASCHPSSKWPNFFISSLWIRPPISIASISAIYDLTKFLCLRCLHFSRIDAMNPIELMWYVVLIRVFSSDRAVSNIIKFILCMYLV